MDKPSVTETLATNLRFFIDQKELTTKEVGRRAGIGQTTVWLYLNPDRRAPSISGNEKSPTLAKVQALADALEVELWELVRPLSPAQRNLIRSVEAVIAEQAATANEPAAREVKPRRLRKAPVEKRIHRVA